MKIAHTNTTIGGYPLSAFCLMRLTKPRTIQHLSKVPVLTQKQTKYKYIENNLYKSFFFQVLTLNSPENLLLLYVCTYHCYGFHSVSFKALWFRFVPLILFWLMLCSHVMKFIYFIRPKALFR